MEEKSSASPSLEEERNLQSTVMVHFSRLVLDLWGCGIDAKACGLRVKGRGARCGCV